MVFVSFILNKCLKGFQLSKQQNQNRKKNYLIRNYGGTAQISEDGQVNITHPLIYY